MYGEENKPRGEFVLIIEGYDDSSDQTEYTMEDAVEIAKKYMEEGNPASMAAKTAASETGFKKGDIYKSLINL
jgi:16S rRNA (cytidine1402-2'-O)-methyltransferase